MSNPSHAKRRLAPPAAENEICIPDIPLEQANLPMTNFCTAYKPPKLKAGEKKRAAEKNKPRRSTIPTSSQNNESEGIAAMASGDGEGTSKPQAGPLVEVVNGEIVIKESSLEIGGTKTQVSEDYEEVSERS